MSRTDSAALPRWLRGPARSDRVSPDAGLVVCCPHSGGSATYFRHWQAQAAGRAAVYAVQYPGRHDRMSEPFAGSVPELADTLAAALCAVPRPTVLFGHSMGASVAFEAARRLRRARHPLAALVVSGHVPPAVAVTSDIHRLPNDEMWAALAELGGTEPEVLEMQELRDVYTPVLRSDLTISADYVDPNTVGCLDVPVVALAGVADEVAPPADLYGWADVTTAEFTLRTFAGDHFFLDDHVADVVDLVADLLPARGRGVDAAAG